MYNGALDDAGLDTNPFTGGRYTFGGGNPISNIELDGHCWSWLQSTCNVINGAVDITINDTLDPVRNYISNILVAGAGIACPSMAGPTGAAGCNQAAQQDIPPQVQQKTQIHVPLGGDPNSRGYHWGGFIGRWILPVLPIFGGLARDIAQAALRAAAAAAAREAAAAAARDEARQAAAAAGDRVAAAAGCGGESFTADTAIVMADGSAKRLDHVKAGDKVTATDPATGKTRSRIVTKVWVNHDTDLMDVTVRSGGTTSVIHSTQHHLFWDDTRKAWTEADRLHVGDRLRSGDGSITMIASTIDVAGAADMWDLTVQTAHDFYVVAAAAHVLVHNCPSPLGRGSTGRTTPLNLKEQLAMEQVQSNPAAGRVLTNVTMTDPRWPAADGWVKMAQNVNGVETHYVYNTQTGAVDDFKFI